MGLRDWFRLSARTTTPPLALDGKGGALVSAPPAEQKAVWWPQHLFWGDGATDQPWTADAEGRRAYVAAALAYICIRYRTQKLVEAPLMVVEETEGGEEWVKGHPLAPLLAKPNPDYGMRRLLEATEVYLCTTGACLWPKSRDRAGRAAALYPLSGDEFGVESANGRLFGRFRVTVNGGQRDLAPDDVVHFSYFHPTDPHRGLAPIDAAFAQLGISQQLAARAKAHVKNAMAPGSIYTADPAWRPSAEEFDRLKAELRTVAAGANSGHPVVAEGGGKFERGWTLADLALGELWRECEAVVCGVFQVPPSLVGTVIGLENSPWSHMATARTTFYEECIKPEWALLEESITGSLLREVDDNPSRLVRFDPSRIGALQKDVAAAALVASTARDWTSVNERRGMMGLPRVDDDGADDIPELTRPAFNPFVPPADDEEEEPETDESGEPKRRRRPLTQKALRLRFAAADDLHARTVSTWELLAASHLAADAAGISAAVARALDAAPKSGAPTLEAKKAKDKDRARAALDAYLEEESAPRWKAGVRTLLETSAERAVEMTAAADTGVAARLLRPAIGKYAEREAAFLVKNVTKTTRDAVAAAVGEGLEAGNGPAEIARQIRDLPAFTRERATLVARTETTRTLTGAPMEALREYGREADMSFVKEWVATMDDRVRDEHAAMHGEKVPIDKAFSNGRMHPDEPACRCGLVYGLGD